MDTSESEASSAGVGGVDRGSAWPVRSRSGSHGPLGWCVRPEPYHGVIWSDASTPHPFRASLEVPRGGRLGTLAANPSIMSWFTTAEDR